MIVHAAHLLAYLFAMLALCGVGYLLLVIFAMVRWKQVDHPPANQVPTISILKSLRGTDRAMYEAFRSHCLLEGAGGGRGGGGGGPRGAAGGGGGRGGRGGPAARGARGRGPGRRG